MANTFSVKINGETAEFESSLKNMNKAMKLLKSEGVSLNKALKVDPKNSDIARKMYSNLNEQLKLTQKQALETKKSLNGIDPKVDLGNFVKLSNKLQNLQTESKRLSGQMSKVFDNKQSGNAFSNLESDASNADSKLTSLFGKKRVLNFGKAGLSAVFSGLTKSATMAVNGVSSIFKGGFNLIKSSAVGIGSVISKSLSMSFSGISTLLTAVGRVSTTVFATVKRGGAATIAVFSKIGSVVSSAFSFAGSSVSKMFSGLSSGASHVKSLLASVASSTTRVFKASFSAIGSSMVSILSAPIKKIGSMLNEIVIGSLRQIGSNITNKIGSTMSDITSNMQKAQTAVNGLKKVMTFKGISGDFEKLSDALNKTAINTNINTEDADKFGSVLVGIGKDATETAKIVDAAANANQSFGGSGENFSSVALALGQIASAGKVTAENMNQITDANSALGAALKSQAFDNYKKAGGTLKDFNSAVTAGKIGVDELNQAMIEVSDKGGSAIKTLPDALDSFRENIASKLQPTFNKITAAMVVLVDRMSDLFDTDKFKSFTSYLESIDYESFFTKVGDVIVSLLKYLSQFGSSVSSVFKSVSGSSSSFLGVLSSLMSVISSKISFVLSLVSKLASALSSAFARSGLGSVSNVISSITNTIQSLVDIIVNVLVVALNSINFNNVRLAINNLIAGIKTLVSLLMGSNIPGLIFKIFNSITAQIATLDFTSILSSLIGIINQIINVITTFASKFASVFTSITGLPLTLNNVIQLLLSVFSSVFSKIISIVSRLGSALSSTFAKIDMSNLTSTFKNLMSLVEDVANVIVNVLGSALSSIDFNSVISGINTLTNIIKSLLSQLNSGLTNTFATIFGDIVNGLSRAIPILNLLSPLLQSAMSLISRFANSLSGAFNNVSFDNVYSMFESIVSIVTSVANTIAALFESALGTIDFSALISGVKSVLDIVNGLISTIGVKLASSIGSSFGSMVNIISKLLPSIKVFSKIFVEIQKSITKIGIAFKKSIRNLNFNSVLKMFDALSEAVSSIITLIGNAISNIIGSIDLSTIVGFITEIFTGIGNVATALGEGGLSKTLSALFGIVSSVFGVFKSLWDSIGLGFDGSSDKASNFKSVMENIDNIIGPILNGIKTTFDNIVKGIETILSKIDNETLTTFIDNIKNATGEIKKLIDESVTGFSEKLDLTYIIGGLNELVVSIDKVFKKINKGSGGKKTGGFFAELGNLIGYISRDIAQCIDDTVKLYDQIVEFIDALKKDLGGHWKDLTNWFSGIFGGNNIDAKVKNYTSPVNNSSSSVMQDNKFNITTNGNMDMRALSREVARLIKSGVV